MHDFILDFYELTFGMPRDIPDKIAVLETLQLVCSGLSNTDVATILKTVEPDDVQWAALVYLDFIGFSFTLDFNPLYIYNCVNGSESLFRNLYRQIKPKECTFHAKTLYRACEKLKVIEEEVKKYHV